MTDRRTMLDGPFFRFEYMWSGLYPTAYELDLSGSGCVQRLSWERIAVVHTLDRGTIKRYHKGWKIRVSLTWNPDSALIKRTYDSDSIPGETETLLNLLYNTTCDEPVFFYPYPDMHPSTYFDVIVDGSFNLQYHRGLVGTGYVGAITLTGKDIFPELPTIGTLGSVTP